MYNLSTELVSAIAAVCAALAAIAAACTAIRTYKHQRKIEKNQHEFFKLKDAVLHLQELIVAFAEIRAISETEWSDNRSQKLTNHAYALRKRIVIIGSLHPKSGNRLSSWRTEKDQQGNSVSGVIDYVLGQLGAEVGDKYKNFFCLKSEELIQIQDELFKEFS